MAQAVIAGGPLLYLVILTGLLGLYFGIEQIIQRGKKDLLILIFGFTFATALVTLSSFAVFMYYDQISLSNTEASQAVQEISAQGIAYAILVWGGILSAVDAVVGCIACYLHREFGTKTIMEIIKH